MADQEEELEDAPEEVEAEEPEGEETSEADPDAILNEKGEAAFEEAFAEVDQDTDDEGGAPGESVKQARAHEDEEDEPEESEEGEEPEDAEDDEDMALHRAYTTLHDSGVPAKVLKRTPRAELIAWAGSVGSEKAGERDESASAGDKTASEVAAGAKEGGTPAQEKAADWAAMRKSLAEGLGIDEESADALKPLHDTIESLRAEVRELRASTDGATAEARAREGRATIDLHVQRLSSSGYSQLARDPKAREKLVAEASVLLKGGMKDATRIFDKAAMLAFGAPKRGDLAQKRRNGVSHPPTIRGEHAGMEVGDENDYFARALDFIDAGRKDLAASLKLPKPKKKAKSRI